MEIEGSKSLQHATPRFVVGSEIHFDQPPIFAKQTVVPVQVLRVGVEMTGSAPTQRQGFVARVKAWKVKRKSRPSAQDDQIQQTAGGELSSDQARSAQSTAASPPAVSIVTTSPTDVPDVRVDPNTSDPNPHRDEADAAPECSSTGPVNAPDLWLEAFDQVDDETKKLINENPILTDNTAQIDELTTMVKDKVERFKDDSWKITINGKERTWSANGQRVIAGIQDVGNIVIAFAPEPASTIWSAVKVLLSVSLVLSYRTVHTLVLIMSTDTRQSMQGRCCYPRMRREGSANH